MFRDRHAGADFFVRWNYGTAEGELVKRFSSSPDLFFRIVLFVQRADRGSTAPGALVEDRNVRGPEVHGVWHVLDFTIERAPLEVRPMPVAYSQHIAVVMTCEPTAGGEVPCRMNVFLVEDTGEYKVRPRRRALALACVRRIHFE